VILLVAVWIEEIFLAVADLMMILRVYAMWNQSKQILYPLLFIYVLQVIVAFTVTAIYDNPNTYLQVTTVQVIDISFCYASLINVPSLLHLYSVIPRFLLGATLLILAVTQTLKESVHMYLATKQWQPNRYMQQLAKDGVLYFLVNALYDINLIIQGTGINNTTSWFFLMGAFYVALCAMMPRFIIGVRELYDRDLRARWQGDDTGFGVLSQPIAIENAVVSAISFANVAPGQGQVAEGDEDDGEAARLGMLGEGKRQAEGDGDDESEAIQVELRTCQV